MSKEAFKKKHLKIIILMYIHFWIYVMLGLVFLILNDTN